MHDIIQTLLREQCSLVVLNHGTATIYRRPGVADLLALLSADADALRGASVADKVVGMAAASLMVEAGVSRIYAATIGSAALAMLQSRGIEVKYGTLAPTIMNRTATGPCPLEALCLPENSTAQNVAAIRAFVAKKMAAAQQAPQQQQQS